MSNNNVVNNNVNRSRINDGGAAPSRCSLDQQQQPSHHVTAGIKWNKQLNNVVIKCYYHRSPVYRDFIGGKEDGFCLSLINNKICDQARGVTSEDSFIEILLSWVKFT